MSKTKKIISLALTLLMVLNIFSVVVSAEGELADYAALTDYIQKNVPIDNDAGIYSTDSYAAVAAILNGIDYELPAAQQSTVDGYLSELQTAVAGLVADESQAVAQFSLTGTSAALHPGDTVEVTFGLTTNYGVISAGAVIIYDSTKFELLGGSSISSLVDHTEGCLSNYTLTGSNANTAKIFAQRNSNTSYWNTNEMKAQYTAVNIGFALNSKISDPVVADGAVATMTFEVLSDVQLGTQGSIFMSSDFNKTSSFAGGLNYASRSVGEKMGPTSSCIAVGQTLNLSAAQLALSIDHTLVVDEAVAATCTESGLTAGSHCSECDYVAVAQEVIPALGHDWDEGTVTTAATCTQAGVLTYACSRCDATDTDVIEALGHDYVATVTEATCTAGGYTTYNCSRCDSSYVADETEALGHEDAEWVIITPATCTTTGLKTKTCSRCGNVIDSEEIAVTAHTEDAGTVTKEATCTEAGEITYACTVCGATLRTEVVEALGHDIVEDAAVAATCTEAGLTAGAHCSRCDYVETAQETIPALGHDWDEGVVTTPATCIQTGVKTYSCSRCDATYTEDIATGAHTPGAAAVETIDGVEKSVVRCTVCGDIISVQDVGLADYTALNEKMAEVQAINPLEVYDTAAYENIMDYIDTIDMTLSAAHQDEVDAYTASLTSKLSKLKMVVKRLNLTDCTAEIDGTTITLTVNEGATQCTISPTLKNVTSGKASFSHLDGPKLSSRGTCYSKVNGTATMTIPDGREFTLVFVLKDPELDVADYTAVDAALEKAAAVVEDDVYDASTYEALEAAVDAVERGLPERRQGTVNGYATAINNALGNVVTVQELIKKSTNARVTKNGDTIVVTRKQSSSLGYVTIYNTLTNGDSVTFLRRGKLTLVSDKVRYSIKQNTTARILLENGREYNILFVIYNFETGGLDELEALVTEAQGYDSDDYYSFAKVEAALDEINLEGLSDEEDMETINYYIITLSEALGSLKTIVSLLKLQYCYATKEGDTITLFKLPNKDTMSIYVTLTNGDAITLTDRKGLTRYSNGTKYYTKTGGTATLTLADGRSYNLVMTADFEKIFMPEYVQTDYIDGGMSYDEKTHTLAYSTSSSIARIYKNATTSRLSIDVGEYDFITDEGNFYEIKSSVLPFSARGVASFIIHSNDGTDVNASVDFVSISSHSDFWYIYNATTNKTSMTVEGNVITITLDRNKTSKTYVQIAKTVGGDGQIVVTSPSSRVENQNNSEPKYTIRYQAAGAEIHLTFNGVEYDVIFEVINKTA